MRSFEFNSSSPLLPTAESKFEKKLKKILGCVCITIWVGFVGLAFWIVGCNPYVPDNADNFYIDNFYTACVYALSGPATFAFLFH